MLQGLRTLFAALAASGGSEHRNEQDPKVAAVALLVHLMDADGVRDGVEETKIRDLLGTSFGLHDGALEALLKAGKQAEADAVDLHGFTSTLMQHWDISQRTEFIDQLWALVFADGRAHELEEHALWRVADLLGIEGRERVEARRRAAAAAKTFRDQGRESP